MNRYEELVSLFMDGEPTPAELDELSALLSQDPDLARDFRNQLILWESFAQQVTPERSSLAFEEAMKVRLRVEQDGAAFSESTTKRILAFRRARFRGLILAAAALVVIALGLFHFSRDRTVDLNRKTGIPVPKEVVVVGEAVCTHCTLHREGRHQKAVRYADGRGETQLLFLERRPELRTHTGRFCGGPTRVEIHGETREVEGVPLLAVSSLHYSGENP
jgi:hypothetical protein